MIVKAPAKLNLAIEVKQKFDSGYHEIDMVSIPIELHDCLEINELAPNNETYITSDDVTLICDESNTVSKAFSLMRSYFKLSRPYRIQIFKSIPIQSGLAGGSADAASLMRAIARDKKLKTTLGELATLSLEIGADVPFCLYNTPARVRGIGEIVEPISTALSCGVLLVRPRRGLSTAEVYAACDQQPCEKPDIDALIETLRTNPRPESLAPLVKNGLRGAASTLCPEIESILEQFRKCGIDCAEMSGSGSCCYGLSSDEKRLEKAARLFGSQGYKTYLTHTLNPTKKHFG